MNVFRNRHLEPWQRDLYILWICAFITQMGFSLIMPFLSLYLGELGVHGRSVELWSGVIFSANFVVMAIVSPIWGGLSDRIGRKPMILRSAFGMAFVVWLMGMVTSPLQLLGLRLLQGFVAGQVPASTAYLAGVVPREKTGYALGVFATGSVAGTVLGPLVGGALSQVMGYRPIFYLTSVACVISGVVIWLTIHEQFTPVLRKKGDGLLSDFGLMKQYPVVLAMSVVLFMNMFSILTAEPILARFLQTLNAPAEWISFLSGVVFSITGVATMMVAPMVGRLSDQMSSRRLLSICLGGAAVLYLLQGFTTATWQMIALRFLLGLFTGGLMPAVNGLLARAVPREIQGRIFGVANSAIFLGNTLGPLVGGGVAATFGLRAVFPVTGALLLLNLVWVMTSVRDPAPSGQLQYSGD